MKQFNNFFSYKNNPSVLGADRLWANVKIGREDAIVDKDYHNI